MPRAYWNLRCLPCLYMTALCSCCKIVVENNGACIQGISNTFDIHDARMHTTCITELWLQSACAKSPLNIPSSHGFGADFNIFLGKIFGDLGSRISRRLSQAYSGYIYKKKPFPHPARTRQTQKHPDKFNTCPDSGLIRSLK